MYISAFFALVLIITLLYLYILTLKYFLERNFSCHADMTIKTRLIHEAGSLWEGATGHAQKLISIHHAQGYALTFHVHVASSIQSGRAI